MSWQVRFTTGAEENLLELYEFVVAHDLRAADRAIKALRKAFKLLELFPFSCRKATGPGNNPLLREMIVPFGNAGYVVLFEIEDDRYVTIIAVRHQREDDYH